MLRRSPQPRDRPRSGHTLPACHSLCWFSREKPIPVQPLTDLPERLKHVRPGALGRTLQILADRFVVEAVDLTLRERQPLLEREALDDPIYQTAGLTRKQFRLLSGACGPLCSD